MFTTALFYNDHKTKQARKQTNEEPKISKTEEIHKSWCYDLRNRQSLTLIACEYYLVVEEYIPLIRLSEKKLVIIDKIKIKQNKKKKNKAK